MSDRVIFHIDVNSAYLSWEAVDRLENGETTDLRLIPSAVGGDIATRHGVILAKSVPAKKYRSLQASLLLMRCANVRSLCL